MIEAEGRCIGNARLTILDEENRRARYAIGLFDTAAWNRGYGTEATRIVLRYAFDVLHLHRVDLVVLEYNHRAIACYKKCGFVQEGVARETTVVVNQWHNDVLMSILEGEYRTLSPGWNLPPLARAEASTYPPAAARVLRQVGDSAGSPPSPHEPDQLRAVEGWAKAGESRGPSLSRA